MKNIEFAQQLMQRYAQVNQALYLVGGSVRDYLYYGDFHDFDFATPCLLQESLTILQIHHYDAFSARFGTLKTRYHHREIEITTFRKEGDYRDFRHPDTIEYITDLFEDAKRRDFTINALYLDVTGKIIDPYQGQLDLQNKILRMIGDPSLRLAQDPVRILRALRFALQFNLTLEPSLEEGIRQHASLLSKISEARGRIELIKMRKHHSVATIQALFDFYKIDVQVRDYIV